MAVGGGYWVVISSAPWKAPVPPHPKGTRFKCPAFWDCSGALAQKACCLQHCHHSNRRPGRRGFWRGCPFCPRPLRPLGKGRVGAAEPGAAVGVLASLLLWLQLQRTRTALQGWARVAGEGRAQAWE